MTRRSLLGLAALLAAPAPAAAAIHYQPGTTCQAAYGEDQVVYWHDGGIYNAASTWWRTAMCPLPLAGGRQTRGYVARVTDASYVQDVSCRMVFTTLDGYTTWGTAATTRGSTGTASVYLQIPGETGRTDANLLCYLPQTDQGHRSGILGYSFDVVSW